MNSNFVMDNTLLCELRHYEKHKDKIELWEINVTINVREEAEQRAIRTNFNPAFQKRRDKRYRKIIQ